MKILLIADPVIPIPPNHYGGAERIVALYAQEFSRLGHRVDLLAGPGSRHYGGQLHIHHAPSKAYLSRANRKIRFQLQSLWAARDCDVVYSHGRFDYLYSLLQSGKPLLQLFPNPIDQQQIDFAEQRIRAKAAFHFISANQASHAKITAPSCVIPNPVDTRAYRVAEGTGNYLVFLGRLTMNKGVDVAIDVARRTGRKLVIAGNVSKEKGGEQYFREQVEPHLDGDQIRWIGPVNDAQKQVLLSNADALLFPIRWDEPFGFVMVEALACGTPVIATRRASTPEVINHGMTGWLCEPEEPSVDAFVEAVHHLHELDRQACRRAAEQRFDVRVVAPRVLEVLTKLAREPIV
ncbi:glycosyltransferase family 4 protein [Synechococcus sp. CCY9201]|uniref:glycosyltransferase family 4 protein n=1 Tax=Synechococcus sp. CCY9201 TaxID=174697 RepID=UPI002B207115|nr:glycosyltransferase family 4 protein [Synechococcus sp. CCY9201]MEA5474677.1 glycosyltransferase family 4 protein [Synechococcus sp. CCY9201]